MNSESPLRPIKHRRFTSWIRHHRTWSIAIAGVILVVTASSAAAYILLQKPPEPKVTSVVTPKPKPEPVHYYSLLNGSEVAAESDIKKPVIAVMIENSPEARPQSGLKDAEVVYEAIAEGGITRFVALYQQNSPKLIGPVRSLRPYFLDYITPYQPVIAHVGGSSKALKEVRNGSYRDIDQFFNANSYWRTADRYAPHNVYTDFSHLTKLAKAKGYRTSVFTSFPRADLEPPTELTAKTVNINFSSAQFNTKYTYKAKCSCYLRYEGGEPHLDREDGQISPKVVIALHVNESTVWEDTYREKITTSGSGKAEIFQEGVATKATWSKKNQSSPLQLLSKSGEPIELARGQTWIAVVPEWGSVSWQ